MSKKKKPKSEVTPTTPNPRFLMMISDADLIIEVANHMKTQTLDNISDDKVGDFVNAIYVLLRDLGCHASITSPACVVSDADNLGVDLNIEQAKKVCNDLMNNDWLGEQFCTTLSELINDRYQEQKYIVKNKRKEDRKGRLD